jgi:translation initiation factor IF-3
MRPPSEDRAIKEQRVRVNDQIRISPVRLIGGDGEQVGIISLDEAKSRADEAGLDLVEVAPDARPPVCKLMDYGKFKYEEARKAREARKKQHTASVKEVKFRPGIETHDFEFKTRHVRRFLGDGDKVRITIMFRGRQMAHPEFGVEVMERVVEAVKDIGKIESNPTREGRTLSMVLAPIRTAE